MSVPRLLPALTLMLAIPFCACDDTPRGAPSKSTAATSPIPSTAAAPAVVTTPAATPSQPAKTWNLADIFHGASLKTLEWPGHPDWSYISIENRDLLIHAQEIASTGTTTLRFPLRPGSYAFQAVSTLDEACTEQVVLNIAVTSPQGEPETVFQTTMIPGRLVPIDKQFELDENGRELSITVRMAPNAANSVNARTRWSLVRLEYWGDAYNETARPAASNIESPSTASTSQGR